MLKSALTQQQPNFQVIGTKDLFFQAKIRFKLTIVFELAAFKAMAMFTHCANELIP